MILFSHRKNTTYFLICKLFFNFFLNKNYFVPFPLMEKEPKRSRTEISSNRTFRSGPCCKPCGAKPRRRFAVRWPAPDGGPSFGWRLIFWLLFYQEKSNKKFFVKVFGPLLVFIVDINHAACGCDFNAAFFIIH